MGTWYGSLYSGMVDANDPIKQEVITLTAGKSSLLSKIQAIAGFVQHDIRYVAIELGIGGWQPHAAAEVFSHRYGDCKDKATLMHAMLHEIGVTLTMLSSTPNEVRLRATLPRTTRLIT